MKDIDELDALHAAAWPGPWTSETWEVECGACDGCFAGDDCEGSHDCETILAPEAYPDGQVVAQTSHADGRIRAPGLEQFARANTAAIVALHNAWPEVSARLRAAEAEVERLRGLVRWFLEGDDHTHVDDCGARGQHDLDVCRNTKPCADETCEGPHCTCDATEMRDRARAALGEP